MVLFCLVSGAKERQAQVQYFSKKKNNISLLFSGWDWKHFPPIDTVPPVQPLTSEIGSTQLTPPQSVLQPSTTRGRLFMQRGEVLLKHWCQITQSSVNIFQIQCQIRERPHSCVHMVKSFSYYLAHPDRVFWLVITPNTMKQIARMRIRKVSYGQTVLLHG